MPAATADTGHRRRTGRPFLTVDQQRVSEYRVNVRLTPDTDALLRRIAEADQRTLAAVVEAAVLTYAAQREDTAA